MMSEKTKKLILGKRKEGKLCFMTYESIVSVSIDEFIKQPADGILYDLNRLEETALTFIDDPKWVNDFAVALTIRALKKRIAQLEKENKALRANMPKSVLRRLDVQLEDKE